MKSVLILTYYWPPAGGPGVQRWLKFAKYLEEFGWRAHILTVRDGTYSALDEQLLKEVPEGIPVYKTRSRDPFRIYNMLKGKKDGSVSVALININKEKSLLDRLSMYIRSNFFIPDARKGWIPFAYKEAMKIISDKNIDMIVTTGPPHSTHLAGLKIKRKIGIKWLADLRDPWTTVYYNDMLPRTEATKRKDKKYEDYVLGNADVLTVVSPGMKKEFSDRNPHIEVVLNGFDLADMEPSGIAGGSDGRFRLTYTGNFKPNQHVPLIWDAISELIAEEEGFRKNFVLSFVGNVDGIVPGYFKEKGLSENIELISYVPHQEVTRLMSGSVLLFFVVPQSRNNKLIITGKLFEYLASGRPVISVGPTGGDASAILEDTARDSMLEYDDKDGFKRLLLGYYRKWEKDHGSLPKQDTAVLNKYSRRSSAGKLADIMHEMTKGRDEN
ncbi:MAG: glycosyltransferase family 4 protein [Bacteroidales bacterium]|nr:glycosyltransferase family 4 protein [Bacteroidales bacterium]